MVVAIVLFRLTMSFPAPMLRLPMSAETVAVSALAPRVTFSRFEKAMEPRVPVLVPETLRVSAVVVEVEVRESVPPPALRFSVVELLFTMMESLPSRVLIVSKLVRAFPSGLFCGWAEVLMLILSFELVAVNVSMPTPPSMDVVAVVLFWLTVSSPSPMLR